MRLNDLLKNDEYERNPILQMIMEVVTNFTFDIVSLWFKNYNNYITNITIGIWDKKLVLYNALNMVYISISSSNFFIPYSSTKISLNGETNGPNYILKSLSI